VLPPIHPLSFWGFLGHWIQRWTRPDDWINRSWDIRLPSSSTATFDLSSLFASFPLIYCPFILKLLVLGVLRLLYRLVNSPWRSAQRIPRDFNFLRTSHHTPTPIYIWLPRLHQLTVTFTKDDSKPFFDEESTGVIRSQIRWIFVEIFAFFRRNLQLFANFYFIFRYL
jgi:hypothetical protein